MENIPVISFQNRWSFGVNIQEHDSILHVLQQVSSNQQLLDILEQVLGTTVPPCVVELSTITSQTGATSQYYHSDLQWDASSARFGRSFSPLYTLLIPLQETTQDMGSTHVCPGTHRCMSLDTNNNVCDFFGFSVANHNFTWHAGTGLLYDGHVRHKGGAHTSTSSSRVVLILSFVASPETTRTNRHVRSLPLGSVYGLRWDHWGMTLHTNSTMNSGISWMRALGITSSSSSGSTTSWDYIRSVCFRIQHGAFGFGLQDLEAFRKFRVGFLGKLPGFLQGRIDTTSDAPWHVYLQETTEKVRTFVGVLYAVGLLVVVLLGGVWWTRNNNHRQQESNKTQRKSQSTLLLCLRIMLAAHVLILLSAWIVMQLIASSSWSQPQADRPFEYVNNNQRSSSYIQSLAAPEYHDVLLTARLDVPSLKAQGRFLEYHPGNQRWYRHVRSVVSTFMSYMFHGGFVFADAVVSNVMDRTSMDGAFLQQNDMGDWFELSNEQVASYTRNLLLLVWLQNDVSAWPNTKYYEMPLCRLSNERRTALCRQVTPVLIAVFEENRKIEGGSLRVSSNDATKRGRFSGSPRASRLPLSLSLRHDMELTSVNRQQRPSSPIKEGDLVEVRSDFSPAFADFQWLIGVVVGIHDDKTYDIELDLENRVATHQVKRSMVRRRKRRKVDKRSLRRILSVRRSLLLAGR